MAAVVAQAQAAQKAAVDAAQKAAADAAQKAAASLPAGCIGGCEGQTVTITAPNNQTITGGTMRYGRWDNTICPHATVSGSTKSKSVTVPIPTNCIGKTTCTLGANPSNTGGDPFPGVFKHFVICPTYSTTPPAPAIPAPAIPAPAIPAPAIPAPAAPPVPSPSMASGSAYAASCTKCTLVNNQLSCSCDVTPR